MYFIIDFDLEDDITKHGNYQNGHYSANFKDRDFWFGK